MSHHADLTFSCPAQSVNASAPRRNRATYWSLISLAGLHTIPHYLLILHPSPNSSHCPSDSLSNGYNFALAVLQDNYITFNLLACVETHNIGKIDGVNPNLPLLKKGSS